MRTAVRFYAIPSESMEPTLKAGDRIVASRYWSDRPARGDIVIFRSPSSPSEWVVKRVVGVPGDLIEAKEGKLRRGGVSIAEPYLSGTTSTTGIAPLIVPPDCYYVLGDNRGDSFDSRQWGAIPRGLIAGRARVVLWSSRSDSRRIFKWIE